MWVLILLNRKHIFVWFWNAIFIVCCRKCWGDHTVDHIVAFDVNLTIWICKRIWEFLYIFYVIKSSFSLYLFIARRWRCISETLQNKDVWINISVPVPYTLKIPERKIDCRNHHIKIWTTNATDIQKSRESRFQDQETKIRSPFPEHL